MRDDRVPEQVVHVDVAVVVVGRGAVLSHRARFVCADSRMSHEQYVIDARFNINDLFINLLSRAHIKVSSLSRELLRLCTWHAGQLNQHDVWFRHRDDLGNGLRP